MNATAIQTGAQHLRPVFQHNCLGKGREATNNDLLVPHSIENTPCQARMTDGPPEATANKRAGEGEIDNEPDNAAHGKPVEERNHDNPVPGIMLPYFFNEGQYGGNCQAWIAERIDQVNKPSKPFFPACFLFQMIHSSHSVASSTERYPHCICREIVACLSFYPQVFARAWVIVVNNR